MYNFMNIEMLEYLLDKCIDNSIQIAYIFYRLFIAYVVIFLSYIIVKYFSNQKYRVYLH